MKKEKKKKQHHNAKNKIHPHSDRCSFICGNFISLRPLLLLHLLLLLRASFFFARFSFGCNLRFLRHMTLK